MKNHFLVYLESENSAKAFGVVCFIDVEKPSMSIGREYQLPFAGQNINLVEAEINAPGRELAYIATSK